jgi:hypothetical protein
MGNQFWRAFHLLRIRRLAFLDRSDAERDDHGTGADKLRGYPMARPLMAPGGGRRDASPRPLFEDEPQRRWPPPAAVVDPQPH